MSFFFSSAIMVRAETIPKLASRPVALLRNRPPVRNLLQWRSAVLLSPLPALLYTVAQSLLCVQGSSSKRSRTLETPEDGLAT